MKMIPITVLVHDGPIARAYLSALSLAGLSPRRIILMVSSKHPSTGKPIASWLPSRWRYKWAENTQNFSLFHWPRFLRLKHPALCERMVAEIGKALGFKKIFFDQLQGNVKLETYGSSVERVMIDRLDDPDLLCTLQAKAPETILFTGGGIVPMELLNLDGIRIIHIHPGFLPNVRGADGLLWSYLTREKPGASCFYMAKGIDVGDIILSEDLPQICIPIQATERPKDQMLYRLLFTYFDPAIRARVFINALEKGADPFCLPSKPQQLNIGTTYHFMHPVLRKRALLKVFPNVGSDTTNG
jgi:hypothetical protein